MIEDSGNGPEPPEDESDDEAVREYGRQRAMDLLIRDAMGAGGESRIPENVVPMESGRGGGRNVALWACAAAIVVGLLGISIWKFSNGDDAGSPVVVQLDSRWKIEAGEGADYSVTGTNLVNLRSGELRFVSVEPAHLKVETPNAVATAEGTRFLSGTIPKLKRTNPKKR